jgi:hypothetical protein
MIPLNLVSVQKIIQLDKQAQLNIWEVRLGTVDIAILVVACVNLNFNNFNYFNNFNKFSNFINFHNSNNFQNFNI